jgi:hypothetical protein
MRQAYFLSAMLFTAVLCISGIGLAAAEPQKNQIVVKTEPCIPNSQTYTFVINGMSKTGHVVPNNTEVDVPKGRNVNVVVKQFTVEYFAIPSGEKVGSDVYDAGNKVGLQDDLIQCSGTTQTVLQGLGPVTAIFDFQAFVTPRGKA